MLILVYKGKARDMETWLSVVKKGGPLTLGEMARRVG